LFDTIQFKNIIEALLDYFLSNIKLPQIKMIIDDGFIKNCHTKENLILEVLNSSPRFVPLQQKIMAGLNLLKKKFD